LREAHIIIPFIYLFVFFLFVFFFVVFVPHWLPWGSSVAQSTQRSHYAVAIGRQQDPQQHQQDREQVDRQFIVWPRSHRRWPFTIARFQREVQ
jgi:hypothetical protein